MNPTVPGWHEGTTSLPLRGWDLILRCFRQAKKGGLTPLHTRPASTVGSDTSSEQSSIVPCVFAEDAHLRWSRTVVFLVWTIPYPLQGMFGNVWRHFLLPQLGKELLAFGV